MFNLLLRRKHCQACPLSFSGCWTWMWWMNLWVAILLPGMARRMAMPREFPYWLSWLESGFPVAGSCSKREEKLKVTLRFQAGRLEGRFSHPVVENAWPLASDSSGHKFQLHHLLWLWRSCWTSVSMFSLFCMCGNIHILTGILWRFRKCFSPVGTLNIDFLFP